MVKKANRPGWPWLAISIGLVLKSGMVSGQNWCCNDVKLFLLDLVEGLRSQLGSQLTGIYLHGSLAMRSYYRPKSDMDLIVVVKKPLGPELAEDLGVAVATHAIGRPSVGSIELSVITAEVAKKVPVPTPFEVHYSSQWHEQILRREIDYTKERTDSDLLSHLTYVLQRGICLQEAHSRGLWSGGLGALHGFCSGGLSVDFGGGSYSGVTLLRRP